MEPAHHRAAINTMAAARIVVEVKKPREARAGTREPAARALQVRSC
jgi:hypothetical protein